MSVTKSTLLPLQHGLFRISYHSFEDGDCVSVALGSLETGIPLVRIHSSCLFGESFGALDCDCADQLDLALAAIAERGSGVVIYRYSEGRGVGLENKLAALEQQRVHSLDSAEAFSLLGFEHDLRDYKVEVQALHDLKVSRNVALISQNPSKRAAVKMTGYEIVEMLHLPVRITEHNRPELLMKKHKFGYDIPGV